MDDFIKIFLVDDKTTINKELTISLPDMEIKLITDDDYSDLLEKVKKHQPRVFILSVSWPDKYPYELCREIKNEPSLKDTKVIFLVDRFDEFDWVKSREVGLDGQRRKPLNSDELVSTIKKMIET